MRFNTKTISALTALCLVKQSLASPLPIENENKVQVRETEEVCSCTIDSLKGQAFSCNILADEKNPYSISCPDFGNEGDTCTSPEYSGFGSFQYTMFYTVSSETVYQYTNNDDHPSHLAFELDTAVNDGECEKIKDLNSSGETVWITKIGCWACPQPEPEWNGSWYITYDSADLADGVLTSSYLTKPGVNDSTDVTVTHNDGTCASGGETHDESVITATISTATVIDDSIDDTLDVAKTLDAAVIASDYSGSFVFCETVTLTNSGLNIVVVQTEYTVTANFLATIGAYTSTLEDDSLVTTVDEQNMSVDGTVVVARCDGATENINQGDILCLEISESASASVGVQSIYNLDLEPADGVTIFEAIDAGENKYIDLVDVDCVTSPGTCTVNVVVPEALFVNINDSGATTFTLNISGDVYLYEMNGKDSESEPKGFGISVELEKPCEGGFLRGVAEMLSN